MNLAFLTAFSRSSVKVTVPWEEKNKTAILMIYLVSLNFYFSTETVLKEYFLVLRSCCTQFPMNGKLSRKF